MRWNMMCWVLWAMSLKFSMWKRRRLGCTMKSMIEVYEGIFCSRSRKERASNLHAYSSLRRHLGWSKKLDKLSSELATYWNYGGSSLNHHKIFHRTMKLSYSRHMWKILVFSIQDLSFGYKFYSKDASTEFIWLREEIERVCSSTELLVWTSFNDVFNLLTFPRDHDWFSVSFP